MKLSPATRGGVGAALPVGAAGTHTPTMLLMPRQHQEAQLRHWLSFRKGHLCRHCPMPSFKKNLGREEFVQKLFDQNKCFENAQRGDVGSQGGNGSRSSLCLNGNRKSTNGPVQCSLPEPIGAVQPGLRCLRGYLHCTTVRQVNIKYDGIPIVMDFILIRIKLH